LTAGAGLAVLAMAAGRGPAVFFVLLVMGVLGIVYNTRLLPRGHRRHRTRIRDIPASKTVLVSLAWGIVTTLLPALYHQAGLHWNTAAVFFWICGLVFVQTSFFDIMDMQGSRIVGKETIPIVLGEKRTMRLLKILTAAMAVLMWITSASGFITLSGLLVGFCPLLMLVFLYIHEHGEFSPGFRQSFLMQSHFLLAGVLAAAGSIVFT
ncbi:MAG: UbiA family prenyltransferase, partial [Desulfosalsimonadaceae bacterium]